MDTVSPAAAKSWNSGSLVAMTKPRRRDGSRSQLVSARSKVTRDGRFTTTPRQRDERMH